MVDEPTGEAIQKAVSAVTFVVRGTVSSPDHAGPSGLRVAIIDRNLTSDTIVVETTTDANGRYTAQFSASRLVAHHKTQPDLAAGVYAGEALLATSETHYNATTTTTIDIALPTNTTQLPSEYESLVAALAGAGATAESLADLVESDERQDLTYLANKTGWDARLIAMASLAAQQVRAKQAAIDPAFYYALYRAGASTAGTDVYRVSTTTAGEVWQLAIDQGVIATALRDAISDAVAGFGRLVAIHASDARSPDGISSVSALATVTFGDDTAKLQQFASLCAQNYSDGAAFLAAVQSAMGAPTAQRVALDGQLAEITLDNAPLMAALHSTQAGPLAATSDLAARGYYDATSWAAVLADAPIPGSIVGASDDARRTAYASVLAAQVKQRFPTAVVAAQIQAGKLPLSSQNAELRTSVQAFLVTHQDNFQIGRQPVEQYLVRNQLAGQTSSAIVDEIKRIQRVYQITRDDQAMAGLLANSVHSAYQIARYGEADFVRTYTGDVGGDDVARQVWARARQVHGAVLGIATHYLVARTAPPIGVHSPPQILDQTPQGTDPDVVAYATLAQLFGSMDFCACDDCRTILSPAAYLVDLLHFIDRDPPTTPVTNPPRANLQSVLFDRRPDIQHLKLTCENTNTVIPYIDLVNETLEYFVANGTASLASYIGHDTDGTIPSAELLANPEFVDDAAYTVVKSAIFPLPLPFDRSLETLRRYFARLGAPLHAAMMTLRESEAVERASDSQYAWRDILIERLAISRDEYRVLSDQRVTVRHLFGFGDETDSDPSVPAELAVIGTLVRRLGVSYDELVTILETEVINPNTTLLPRIAALGVPFATLRDLHTGIIARVDFGKLVPRKLDPGVFGGMTNVAADGSNYDQVLGDTVSAWLANADTYARVMKLTTIANPSNSTDLCAYEELELRYANPDPTSNQLVAADYVRLIRFVRLWRKLGWTIAQTDAAIVALASSSTTGNALDQLDVAWVGLLPRLGVITTVIDRLGLRVDTDFSGLLACWFDIGTQGSDSLYRRMFLNPTVVEKDGAFADTGFGDVLQDTTQFLVAHGETLRAAFGLTDDELSSIVDDLVTRTNNATPAPATPWTRASLMLTLPNISAVYRAGWLAHRMRLSVVELLLLVKVTGLDPFALPDPPTPPIVALLDLVDALRAAMIQPTQALYLLWDQDISGRSAPAVETVTTLARTLRADFAAVESDFAIVDDPDGEIARARMTLVYGTATSDLVFGLLDNTYAVSIPYAQPPSPSPAPLIVALPGRVSYDSLAKRLQFSGYLDTATKATLAAAAAGVPELVAAAGQIETAMTTTTTSLFADYPELQALLDDYSAAAATSSPQINRAALLSRILPALKVLRKREQALTAISAATNTDLALVAAIMNDTDVLHAARSTSLPALDDFTVFDTVPTATIGATWSGYLDPRDAGLYDFEIDVDPTVTNVTLVIAGIDAKLVAGGSSTWTNSAPITLTPGSLVSFVLTVTGSGTTIVKWGTRGHAWEVVPAERLYDQPSMASAITTYTRFLKASQLAASLRLTADELAYLAGRKDMQIELVTGVPQPWLDALPVGIEATPTVSRSLCNRLIALLQVARVKAAVSPNDDRLLQVLRNPAVTVPGKPDLLVLGLAGWDAGSLDSLLARFGKTLADVSDIATLGRIYDAFALARLFGISASALLAATTNVPDAWTSVVRDFQSAVRARYDAAGWLQVVQPINDALRVRRRDALVALVLQQFRASGNATIDTPDKLFEYFLMDVEMDACMKTSRIRQALSSVQLFVERCLMNLEQRVAPVSLDAAQWEWMRRYRVWEANRQVFLWPENWLEPELRDHQSPMFKETMSELLQADITEDAAEVALLNYLAKLEEVAKLEPCGMFYESYAATDKTPLVRVHVVARTSGAHRKYFYRKQQGGVWLPWEQIKLEIEDNPILPYVWNGRLLLFWLKLMKQGPDQPNTPAEPDPKKWTASDVATTPSITVQAVLCWSELYNGKWQAMKTSSIDQPAMLLGSVPKKRRENAPPHSPGGKGTSTSSSSTKDLPQIFSPPSKFVRSELHLGATLEGDALRIVVSADLSGNPSEDVPPWCSFLFYNTHSLPEIVTTNFSPTINVSNDRSLRTANAVLDVTFDAQVGITPSEETVIVGKTPITTTKAVEPLQGLADWNAPFFYADGRHVFYVTPTNAPYSPPGTYGPIAVRTKVDYTREHAMIDPVIHGPGDPEPNIEHRLETSHVIEYGTAVIGSSGSVE